MNISSIASRSFTVASGDGAWSQSQAIIATPSFVAPKLQLAQEGSAIQAANPSPERVEQAVKQVNEAFNQKGQNLYAAIERDKTTGIHVVKVLDKHTDEVISQFPSKEILAIAEAIDQSLEDRGQLLNVRA
ncbi:MAG: flagellar protein FlaG [Gallionellaceae bacterium]|nr:flagellar protein FlaG [Gallionellaceae bacterium]